MTGTGSRRVTVRIAAAFFVSGAASLALEIAWSRQLRLVFGSTTEAVTTVLVAYMLGLGLGGLLGGRLSRRVRNGLAAYGLLEVLVGLYALAVPALLPAIAGRIEGLALAPGPALGARFLGVLLLLLVPTLAMGAGLPLAVAGLRPHEARVGDRVGLLYATNTLGAVAGVLLATFVGFRLLGLSATSHAAALLDLGVGALVFALHRHDVATAPDRTSSPTARALPALLVLSYALVGFTSLSCEVAWTRALTMVLGSSTYAFATMLAGFLCGIALGSLFGRRLLARTRDAERLYARLLILLGGCLAGTLFLLGRLPGLFLAALATVGIEGASLVALGLAASFLVMLLPTVVLGALLPVCVRAVVADDRDPGGLALGRLYFWNTVGAAAGALTTGFLLVPRLGLSPTLLGAAVLPLLLALAVALRRRATVPPGRIPAVALAGAALLLLLRPTWNAEGLARGVYYRSSAQLELGLPRHELLGAGETGLLFYEEGRNATVSVHRSPAGLEEGGLTLSINGKPDASLADLSTQILSGHLAFLFGAPARSALVIGYASGITVGSAATHPLERLVACEIEPAVIDASRWFEAVNGRPLDDPRVELVSEDGRAYLERTDETFDVIVSEPSNPWISGCANLFTEEFFQEAHAALSPGGRLLQWIQLYGMDEAGLASILDALLGSFGNAYGFLFDAEGTDLLLVGTDRAWTAADLPRWEDVPEAARHDLARVRVFSEADLLSLFVLRPADLRRIAARAPRSNTDDSMFVELRAPWLVFDETPATREAVLAEATGAAALVDDPELRAEVALSYLDRRDLPRLAAATIATVPDGTPERAAYEVRERLESGAPADELVDALDRVLAAHPDCFVARKRRAWLLNRLGRHDQALADVDAALSLRPGDLELRHERLKGLAALGRMREAWELSRELLASPLVETEPRLLAEGAVLSGGFSRFDEAIATMEEYLTLEPDSPEEWRLLTRWYELAQDGEGMRRADENARIAQRNVVRRLHWLARWNERFGSVEDAREALQEVLRQDPENALARRDLERLEPRG